MTSFTRRAAAGLLGAGAAALMLAPAATAERPPNCTAADLSGVASGVAAATSAYLFTHPEVNDFFTSLEGLDRATIATRQQEYFDSHPQVRAELDGIRQPMTDVQARCGAPVEPLAP